MVIGIRNIREQIENFELENSFLKQLTTKDIDAFFFWGNISFILLI